MKKNKKTEAPEALPDDYVINDKQMEQLIYDLSKTIYWQAVVKYLLARKSLAETGLYTMDPFKQPTETARSQGIRSGLMDIIDYVDSLNRLRSERVKEKEDSGL